MNRMVDIYEASPHEVFVVSMTPERWWHFPPFGIRGSTAWDDDLPQAFVTLCGREITRTSHNNLVYELGGYNGLGEDGYVCPECLGDWLDNRTHP